LKNIKYIFLTGLFFLLYSSTLFAISNSNKFPHSPDPVLTPGSLCEEPDERRYKERIPYCKRDVDSDTKKEVITTYDETLGYSVGKMNRHDFKIDHYIPLCMGGDNDEENLWPQHKSVYVITDPLEHSLCRKMIDGRIRQAEAVEIIKRAKANPFDSSLFEYL